MKSPSTSRPTDAELVILAVLWRRGPSTVREAWQEIAAAAGDGTSVGYTTILKQLQIMADKGLVDRDESSRAHVYRARAGEAPTRRYLVRDLVDRAFEGSAARLVQAALDAQPASAAELREIRRLLDEYEEEKTP